MNTTITITPDMQAAVSQLGILARVSAWIGARQQALSDRAFAQSDALARSHNWEITNSTGRSGFGARTYCDRRFAQRRAAMAGADCPRPTRVRPFRELAR